MKGGWTCLGVELGLNDFTLSLVLFIMTLVVVHGISRGLYFICGRLYGYLPEVLSESITPLTLSDTDLRFQLLIVVLDPFISWFSIIFMVLAYLFTGVMGSSNIFIEALIVYLCVVMGFIFPWRLFIRIFEWSSSKLYKYGLRFRPIIGIFSLILSILFYYVLFFAVLLAGGPFLTELYNMFDPSMRILAKQLYIQHVQAYATVFGFGMIYIAYDIIFYKFVKK